MSQLFIKEVFRYARPYNSTPDLIDGFRNHFSVTASKFGNQVLLEKGISPIGVVKASDGLRTPAIIIRSSPHKIGTETTPWQDVFDVDNGHIRYYGDNKLPGSDPALAPGNKILLELFSIYNDSARRAYAVPLIFYKSVSRLNKPKGFIEFNGYGIIKGVELITQYDRKLDRTFSNYAFDFHVFSMAKENELFNWSWINDRKNPILATTQTLINAPSAWKEWIKLGNKVLEKNRRRVSKLLVVSAKEQIPSKGSREAKILSEVYNYYSKTKSRFEILAAEIASKVFRDSVGHFKFGWITPPSSDGGADFYGRIDLGNGFGKAKLLVLGQDKCEALEKATGGNHVARTVARLRRGWVGVYVTTSYFSESVQREIIEDEYPIMLINGKRLAEALIKILHDEEYPSLKKYLNELDSLYINRLKNRKPDELLFE